MKRIITGAPVAQYVAERLGLFLYPPFTGIGLEVDGRIVAGVILNNYTRNDVDATVAGETQAFTRAFIRRIGRYIFNEANCLRVSITTEQENIIDFVHRLGGQTEGRKRDHFGQGRDGIILGILKQDWKF